MSRKDVLWTVLPAGATLLVLGLLAGAGPSFRAQRLEQATTWKQGTISVGYIGCQLKQIDKAHSSLIVSYDLENNTDTDYRLADGAGVLILSRLKSDGSFSQEQPVRLSYPVFLPAKQRARLAIEITQPFAWPAEKDPAAIEKLREFVKQRLENVGDFVLFDENNRWQLDLPSGWDELQDASSTSD